MIPRTNFVSAAFERPEAAEAAVDRLAKAGFTNIDLLPVEPGTADMPANVKTHGGVLVRLDAGNEEDLAREILLEAGAEMRDQPA